MRKFRYRWLKSGKKNRARFLSLVLAAMLIFTLAPLTPLERVSADEDAKVKTERAADADASTDGQRQADTAETASRSGENTDETASADTTGSDRQVQIPSGIDLVENAGKAAESTETKETGAQTQKDEQDPEEKETSIEYEGNDYTATAESADGFEAGTVFKAEEITGEAAKEYTDQAADVLQDDGSRISGARFFDISFRNKEGDEIRPEVTVKIAFDNALKAADGEVVKIVQIPDGNEEAELLNHIDAGDYAESGEVKSVRFRADESAVYGVLIVGKETAEEKGTASADPAEAGTETKDSDDISAETGTETKDSDDISAETGTETKASDKISAETGAKAEVSEVIPGQEEDNPAGATGGSNAEGKSTAALTGEGENGSLAPAKDGNDLQTAADSDSGLQTANAVAQNEAGAQREAEDESNAGTDTNVTGVAAVDHPLYEGLPGTSSDTQSSNADDAQADKSSGEGIVVTGNDENSDGQGNTPQTEDSFTVMK